MTQLAHANYSPYNTEFNQQVTFGLSSSHSSNNDENIYKIYINSKISELESCLTKLNHIKNYQNNWDGYNAKQPGQLAINNTQNLLKRIFSLSYDASMNWSSPYISADSEGNIVLEWWGINNKKITLYVGAKENYIEYLKSSNDKINEMEDGEIQNFNLNCYVELFSWLNR